MLNKIGIPTFYGPAFLVDICELDNNMLPYTEKYFSMFFEDINEYEIAISDYWYLDRTDYSEKAIGVPRTKMQEKHDFELINGNGIKTGKLFGGCIESLYDLLTGERYGEENIIAEKYELIPSTEDFKDKILFIETSEEKATPEKLEKMLEEFKKRNIFSSVQGILVGKPCDEVYYEEYKEVYKKVFKGLDTPVLYNINFGHSYPKCIIPYDAMATIDFDNKKISVDLKNIYELEDNHKKVLTKNN